jgi:cation:H+ antiporter
MPPELTFVLTAVVVVVAGARLARDGERIADRTGLGQGWVGAILVAGATSLPEIATDVAAVRQGQVDLALGDLFGSSMANMLILGAADLFTRGAPLLRQVEINQAMVGVLAMALTAVAAAAVLSADTFAIAGIGWAPIVIAVAYVLGVRLIHTNRSDGNDDADGPAAADDEASGGLRAPAIGFAVSAVAILAAAPFLASSAATLAEQWGIASGFFGMVFLAAATSLPEVAVVWAALRAGAPTLAVGNLFGSNCFNMVVLLVLDATDGGGTLLAEADPGVVVGALFAIVLTGQALLDLLNRSEHRVWYVEPGPGLIVLTYAAGLFLSYGASH